MYGLMRVVMGVVVMGVVRGVGWGVMVRVYGLVKVCGHGYNCPPVAVNTWQQRQQRHHGHCHGRRCRRRKSYHDEVNQQHNGSDLLLWDWRSWFSLETLIVPMVRVWEWYGRRNSFWVSLVPCVVSLVPCVVMVEDWLLHVSLALAAVVKGTCLV